MKSEELLDEAPKQTAKERLLEVKDKDIPLDLFLFSCLEQERLLRATAQQNHEGWPVLANVELAENKSYLDEASFESSVQRLIAWYRDQFPLMTSRAPLNHEALPAVVPPMVALDRDLETLHQLKLQSALPLYVASATPPSAEWGIILAAVNAAFPQYAKYFVTYLQWSHGAEVVEDFVPGSRPPVGRYAPPPLRKDGPGGRRGPGGSFDRSGPKGPRGGRDARGPRPENQAPAPKRGKDNPKAQDGRGRQQHRRDQEDRPARRDRQPGPRPSESETQRLTEVALVEVEEALAKLRDDSGVQAVKLKPTNSFYRRIQHQKIVDAGFESSSVGEGADRAVQVTRKA